MLFKISPMLFRYLSNFKFCKWLAQLQGENDFAPQGSRRRDISGKSEEDD
jgi:hypothetical protein